MYLLIPTVYAAPATRANLLRDLYRAAFVEAINTFKYDHFAFHQPVFNRYPRALSRTGLDEADLGSVIFYGLDVSAL